jgi:hypothetical protein
MAGEKWNLRCAVRMGSIGVGVYAPVRASDADAGKERELIAASG